MELESLKEHVLGYEIQGCIPQDVKEVTFHTLCYDTKTKHDVFQDTVDVDNLGPQVNPFPRK